MRTMQRIATLAVVACCGCASPPPLPKTSPAMTPEAAGMVDVSSLVPELQLDVRYATANNFTGVMITGYEAPRCYLLRRAAQALQQVQASLRDSQLQLHVFDCYRPVRAVQHFVRWAADLDDQRTKPAYYPRIDKASLIPDYISAHSGHSRGVTLDLTLARCDAGGQHCQPLDMGTTFDFFDVRAHTDSPDVTPKQRDNRQRLRTAMENGGFRNYPLEWWHYSLHPEPSPDVAYDFVVR